MVPVQQWAAAAVTGWNPANAPDPLDDVMAFYPEGERSARGRVRRLAAPPDLSQVAQVVGLLIGSPEFQRR